MNIDRILVANRGEIARRVFRTCRRMGIATVAVYSEPDRDEPHVVEADLAVPLGGAAPVDTYLDVAAIVDAASKAGADAVHPGYGFLSENPSLARAVTGAGLTWIGPPADAMELMGSKLRSKELVEGVGVPVLRGVEVTQDADPAGLAEGMSFPLLVKASAGGGGKGMRVVSGPEALAEAVGSARRESESAFGDGTVFLEPYLVDPRHIEIQVLGDSHGNVVSLYERECSIQRRHQKIIEEAPSPALDPQKREEMGEAAVAVGQAVGYEGAGTVEFLYDDGDFYFLEMNTRLQVEHPVTEMITGIDLVRLQIEMARGERVPEVPPMSGHAVEARLYAEDPSNEFLPVTGMIHEFEFPEREGLRVDSGVEAGSRVTVHYDPLLAKVIAHAGDRPSAVSLLADALRAARIHASTTNRSLLVRVLEHPEFAAGETDTGFLERHGLDALSAPLAGPGDEHASAVAAALADQALARAEAPVLSTIPSGWRNSRSRSQSRSYRGAHGTWEVDYDANGPFRADGLGKISPIDASPDSVVVELGGVAREFVVARYGKVRQIDSELGPARLEALTRFPSTDRAERSGSLHAPMPGKVVRIEVDPGSEVATGDPLVVLEAMKMEHVLRAPHDGTVTDILSSEGDQVEGGQVLVVVE